MKTLILILLVASQLAPAAEKTKPVMKLRPTTARPATSVAPEMEAPIRKGTMVSVDSYEKKSKTYSLTIIKEAAVGPNIALPGDIASSIEAVKLNMILEKPDVIVGNTYTLDRDLMLLSEKGVALRIKALNSKK